jgi:hypothetical protein
VNGDLLCTLLGQPSNSQGVEALLYSLRPRQHPPGTCTAIDYYSEELDYPALGMRLVFSDKARHMNRDRYLWTHEGVTLTQIEFFNDRSGFQQFLGTLPFGLSWQDNRETATKKLLIKTPQDSRFYTRCAFTFDTYEVSIGFSDGKLSEVTCFAMAARLTPLWAVPQPSFDSLQGLLGQTISELFALSTWGEQFKEFVSGHENGDTLDLRLECGLEIYLSNQRKIEGLKFHRDRELDATQWIGELPLDLNWDCSPAQLKLLQPEHIVRFRDDEFDGYVLWQFDQHDFHVYYSNWLNHLSRITLGLRGFLC